MQPQMTTTITDNRNHQGNQNLGENVIEFDFMIYLLPTFVRFRQRITTHWLIEQIIEDWRHSARRMCFLYSGLVFVWEKKKQGEANVHWIKSKLQSPDIHFHNPSQNSNEFIFLFSLNPYSVSHFFESYAVNPNAIHYQTKLSWIFQSFDQKNYWLDFLSVSSLSLTNEHFTFNQFNAINGIIIEMRFLHVYSMNCGQLWFTKFQLIWVMKKTANVLKFLIQIDEILLHIDF